MPPAPCPWGSHFRDFEAAFNGENKVLKEQKVIEKCSGDFCGVLMCVLRSARWSGRGLAGVTVRSAQILYCKDSKALYWGAFLVS
jgi:hypothetical protein